MGRKIETVDVPTPGTFGVIELPSKRFHVYRASDGAEIPFLEESRR